MQSSLLPMLKEKGFTLIELLIAIFIFAIVISSVYGAYRATFHIVQGSEYQLNISNKARIVVERLTEDLGSIVTGPGGVFQGERHKYADSRGDSLSFVSLAHLVLRKTDMHTGRSLIQYQSELDQETGLLNLYRSETVFLPGSGVDVETDDENGQRHLICQGLLEFRFTYLDRDGNESEEWQVDEVMPSSQDNPPGESPFPTLVLIELKFAKSVDSDRSTVFKTAVALPYLWGKQG